MPVPEYEEQYEVSDLGNVRSRAREVRNTSVSCRSVPAQVIAPYVRQAGYATVRLAKGGKKTSHYVHRLVAEAFHGRGSEGREVLHRNGNKADNRAANLSWGSRLDNMADRQRLGEAAKGESHGHAKLTEDQVRQIRDDKRYQHIIAEEYGVSRRLIGMIKKGVIWRHVQG